MEWGPWWRFDPDGSGDMTGTHIAWSAERGVAKKSSLLMVDGLLYMNSDDGVVSCRDPETGEIHWQKRAGGEYAASPIYADGRIYLFSVEGDVLTLEPGTDLQAARGNETRRRFHGFTRRGRQRPDSSQQVQLVLHWQVAWS